MKTDAIQALLEQALPCREVLVETADHVHYQAIVVSDSFIGKTPIQRQQAVYAVLGAYLQSGEIHALALKTWTVEEWLKRKSTSCQTV